MTSGERIIELYRGTFSHEDGVNKFLDTFQAVKEECGQDPIKIEMVLSYIVQLKKDDLEVEDPIHFVDQILNQD